MLFRQCRIVAGVHEQSRFAVHDQFRGTTDGRGHHRYAGRMSLEQDIRQTFGK